MQETEFCYWLQEAFELAEISALSAKQIKLIRRHIDLVKATMQKAGNSHMGRFFEWLPVALDLLEPDSQFQTQKIMVRLSAVFEHAIDPTQEAKPGMNLDAAHT